MVYSYTTALNGMAVKLTAKQASALKTTPGVLGVWKNQIQTIQTTPSRRRPHSSGSPASTGVWKKQFGGDSHAGQGIIIGDIDTGFWPENPSFAALSEPRADDAIIASKFHGICDTGGRRIRSRATTR